jgi:histidinol phosphatase-like PHP family hydrolase/predicted nuclease with RNAse H fold/DNA polymerase/3'-5' exonuclease PolX/dephospho-CoA kinase
MFDFEIARFLYRVNFLLLYLYDSTYKARAYFKAALAVDGYGKSIIKLYQNNSLKSLPHIGNSIEKHIIEIIKTGKLSLIDELLKSIPETIFEILEHSSIHNNLMKKIFRKEIYSFSMLQNEIIKNNDYFSKSEKDIIKREIDHFNRKQFQYAHVKELADDLIAELKSNGCVINISPTGNLRIARDLLTHGNIICSSNLSVDELADKIKSNQYYKIMSIEDNRIIANRFSIDFVIDLVDDSEFFYQLALKTGDQNFYEALRTLPKDKFLNLNSEQELFAKLELYCLPPRLRNLPHDLLLNKNDSSSGKAFFGDLHLHTNWSDGIHTIEQMCEEAERMNYQYIAITDHSQLLKPLGMSELDALTQINTIKELNKEKNIHIFSGIEVDIKADGSLDYPDNILKRFDLVIASIHSHFNQSPFEMIERIRKALQNRYVNIFAHPTGRLLGKPGKISVQRDEIWYDFESLLRICKENNVALEINCFPERFDLNLNNVIKAINYGVYVSVGSDSHSMFHMENTKYAIEMLRDLNISGDHVLNFKNKDELENYLSIKKDDINITNTDLNEKLKNYEFYFINNQKLYTGKDKVIGIDLTGSEQKASGFAILEGKSVSTELILTDNDIIQKVLLINPAIVSIDSPLSLPVGRCCGDKNCDCAVHGIMRYCELTLKRFGIGVYPCLIDSMVNLTMRGIKLAKILRNSNINVIESYPGVAQDLLHIPRKRSGKELLIKGLRTFGLENIQDNITHDEADAITSALVGCFYLNDLYVGMGNEKEGYLIIPRLNTDLFSGQTIIGLTGKISAGKTTIAEYLRFKYGFKYLRYSKIIEELYSVNGREELQRIGLEIAKDPKKQTALSERMIEKMDGISCYVIDGLRQPEDYQTMLSFFRENFILININTAFNKRFNRYKKQNQQIIDIKEFSEIDEHKVELHINALSEKRDYQINNNRNYKELMEQVDSLIRKIANGG